MKQNDNLNPLPWYDSLNYQDRFKRYAYGEIFPLITPNWNLLPFQIPRDHVDSVEFAAFDLYYIDGVKYGSILDQMQENGLQIILGEETDWIVNKMYGSFPILLPEGLFYAVMSDGFSTWYSEVFCVCADTSRYLQIEYWCNDDLQNEDGDTRVIYDGAYRNRIWVDTVMGKPNYDQTEEVETRDTIQFPEKRISQKQFQFEFIAPEYLCDAIRAIWLSDHVKVYSEGIEYDCRTFTPEVKWQEDGHYSAITVEFEADTVLKRIGSVTDRMRHHDFNDDFNEDYY